MIEPLLGDFTHLKMYWVADNQKQIMHRVLLVSAALLGGKVGLAHPGPRSAQSSGVVVCRPARDVWQHEQQCLGTAGTPTGSPAAGPLSTIRTPNI